MKRGKQKRILAGLMAFLVAFTSLSWDGIAAMAQEQISQPEKQGEEAAYTAADYLDPEEVTPEDEIKEERTSNKTVYHLGGNKRMEVIHSSDVRYKDSKGKWVDYDPSLTPIEKSKSLNGNSLKGYAYTNSRGDNKNYLPEKLTGDTPVRMEKDRYSISFHPVMAKEEEQTAVEEANDTEAANEEEESSEEEASDAANEEDEQSSEQEQEEEEKTTDNQEEAASEESGQEEGISSIDSMSMEEDETEAEEAADTSGPEKEAEKENAQADSGEAESDSEARTAVTDVEAIQGSG